jgi:two-component system sensor histidine kinase GlrK
VRLGYPRSFLGLLVAGVALLTAPLAIGLGIGALYTERLATIGQSALARAVQATQASRRIADLMRELERSARQSVILGESALPEHYVGLRQELGATAAELADLPFDPEQRAKLKEVMQNEQHAFALLARSDLDGQELGTLVGHFATAHALIGAIIERSDALIERESRSMMVIAQRAQQVLFWLAVGSIPLAIAVVAGFAMMLARPVRKLDQAIGLIGAGKLSDPVTVRGPRDLELLGRRLEWLRLELLDLEEQKNRFLRQIAHALKTPLAAVRESAELLAERGVHERGPTEQELMQILRRNGLELQRRIEELLQLGEADFRRLTLNIAPVALAPLLAQVRDDQRLAAQAKRLQVEIAAYGDAKEIRADPDKVRVIVDNLLSNAIKHAPPGSTIELFTRRERDAVTIGVRDEGRGIPLQDRSRVFDPFYQGAASGSGGVKSSGVGLAIVREYAAAHGGRAWVADDERGGAQVCVLLPALAETVKE